MARRGHPLPTLPHQGANLRFAGGGRIRDARLLFPRPLRADRPASRWGRVGAGVAVLQAAALQPAGPGRGSLSMAEIKTEVLIAGGGMVGMATAIGLARAGIACVLVDAEPAAERVSTGYDGRSSAIAYGSQQALMSLGIWAGMADEAQPILDIRVSDGRPGEPAAPLFLHYDHLESGLNAPFGAIVENRAIRRALLARLAELPQVSVIAPARVAGMKQGPVSVTATLEDGTLVNASLVVAADGARSALRAAAGIGVAEFAYAQTGIVCTVSHELPHEGVAHEHFLPAGPFAMLPMKIGRASCR